MQSDVFEEAKNEFAKHIASFQKENAKKIDWMSTLADKGTLQDKIASLTVLIQDNPIYNLDSLRRLVSMIKVGKRKECTLAIDNLPELFAETLLKKDSKLLKFEEQALNELVTCSPACRKQWLINWYFEDQLREIFGNFVGYLKNLSHDSLETNREKAVRAIFYLLMGTTEQQKELLECAVNKIGDLSKKLVSKILYYFKRLSEKRPKIKMQIVNEIEKLLFRSNIDEKCQYYAICVLVSFQLKPSDVNVSNKLIDIYFSFFKACVKTGDVNTKFLQNLLNGVNSAYKVNRGQTEKITEHVNVLYKIVHLARFNISLNTISLLFETLNYSENNDRFYGALYRVMLRPELAESSHQFLFLSLMLRSLKIDKEVNRVRAFIKRLLQIALTVNSAFCSGILFILSQLLSENSELWLTDFKNLPKQVNSNYKKNGVPEDDEEEAYQDIDENDVSASESTQISNDCNGGWVHRNSKDDGIRPFDSFHRNPRFAGAQFSIFDELLLLRNHFHPSVALFANKLLNGENINYDGNPLRDFGLMRFLDKFGFKNPKKNQSIVSAVIEDVPADEKFLYNYFKMKKGKTRGVNEDNDSDNDSVNSDEFNNVITKMMGINAKDFDFSKDVKKSNSKKLKKTHEQRASKDEDNFEDHDDDDDDDDDDEQEEGFEDLNTDDECFNENMAADFEEEFDDV